MKRGLRDLSLVFLILLFIAACVTTPVTQREALILIPFEQEVALGDQAYREMTGTAKESADPRLRELVLRVGRRIAAASDMPDLSWEFKLIESDTQNAFALPGGKVAVYTGILKVAENEAGLATVLGHEVAHAVARHGAQRISQQMLLQGGLTVAAVTLSNQRNRNWIMPALGLGATVGITLPFSRMNESEADEIGIVYMARAGYDPRESVRFWQRFNQLKGSGQPPEFLSTHPSDETRITRLKELLPKAMDAYQKTNPKFGEGDLFLRPADLFGDVIPPKVQGGIK